jgi:hypothetical protein
MKISLRIPNYSVKILYWEYIAKQVTTIETICSLSQDGRSSGFESRLVNLYREKQVRDHQLQMTR